MDKAVARPVTGDNETIELAQTAITQATTIDELRQAQAVLLQLQFGLSLEYTSQAIVILPHVNTHCMQRFLNKVSQRHPQENIVMVMDGAGWHRSGALKAPDNIYLLKLLPYTP